MACAPVGLDAGNHDPGAGRCLMEYVSELAGEHFHAWPRCTHPAVAALAVGVNDQVSPSGRTALVSRAPALAVARDTDPALAWRLVGVCAEAVLAQSPDDTAALRRRRRAARARRSWGRAVPPALRRRLPGWVTTACALAALDDVVAAFHAVVAAAGPAGPGRDAVLVGLLDAVLAEVGASGGTGPTRPDTTTGPPDPPAVPAATAPTRVREDLPA